MQTGKSLKENLFCNCMYFTANSLARTIGKIADEAFSETQLPPSYAFVLMTAIERPGINQKEIGCEMMLTPSTITRFVDKLVAKGFLYRSQDGKNMHIYPTEAGIALKPTIKTAQQRLYQK